jgi:hypothetical protein
MKGSGSAVSRGTYHKLYAGSLGEMSATLGPVAHAQLVALPAALRAAAKYQTGRAREALLAAAEKCERAGTAIQQHQAAQRAREIATSVVSSEVSGSEAELMARVAEFAASGAERIARLAASVTADGMRYGSGSRIPERRPVGEKVRAQSDRSGRQARRQFRDTKRRRA